MKTVSTPRTSNRTRLGVEHLETRENPSGGLLDPTFGTGGLVTLPTAATTYVADTAVQTDGKTLTVGGTSSQPYFTYGEQATVTRLNANGTLDTSFGSNGTVTLSVGTGSSGTAVAVEPDGKILVAAHVYANRSGSQTEFAIVRLNSNGTLDTSFGNHSGWWLSTPTSNSEALTSLAVVPSGTSFSIYGGGEVQTASTTGLTVVKLDATGAPVSTYGTNGISTQNIGMATGDPAHLAVSATGEAFIVGYDLAAFTPSGQLDTNFNGTGYVTHVGPWSAVAIQGNDVLVAGVLINPAAPGVRALDQAQVSRYTMTGALDTTFGTNGTYTMPVALLQTGEPTSTDFSDIAVEADGSIALVGYANYTDASGQGHRPLVAGHLSADGVPDTSFGTAGTGFITTTAFSPFVTYLPSLALDSAGDFVIGGESQTLVGGNTWQDMGQVVRITHP